MSNEDLKFPYYSGNIFLSEAIGDITLKRFIEVHKNPLPSTLSIISAVNDARARGDTTNKKLHKQKLHTFTPGVMIGFGDKRQYANIKSFTGLMQLDFDSIPDLEIAKEVKQHIFDLYPEIVVAYLSPSGLGVKALMKIKIDTDPKLGEKLHAVDNEIRMFKALHKSIAKEFEQFGYFDMATKNAILPLFLSQDPDILYREFDDCPFWIEQDWSKTKYVSLNDDPKPVIRTDNSALYNLSKVERIITKRIEEIVDNGHPQVRSTALVLGSRVGAGYISQSEAEHLLENLIKGNSYLQKGIVGYVRTAMWGINEGIKQPKYF
jgi:hypothetical protein